VFTAIKGGPGTNHTYDFAADPALTFDSAGRAFSSCVALDLGLLPNTESPGGLNGSSVLVASSPLRAGGAFYNDVPVRGPVGVVAVSY
jgi:hypothetical protein